MSKKAKPRGKPFVKGDPRAGRPKGVPNKATQEIREIAQGLTTANPEWIEATRQRLLAGTESSTVVALLLHYAHGKPKETVELSDPDGKPLSFTLTLTTPDRDA